MSTRFTTVLGLTVILGLTSGTSDENEVVDFAAYGAGSVVNVKWVANAPHAEGTFYIERSRDGKTFTAIQTVQASAVSHGLAEFVETDRNPLPGWSYYRIAWNSQSKEERTHHVPVFFGLNRIKKTELIAPEALGSNQTSHYRADELLSVEHVLQLRSASSEEFTVKAKLTVEQQRLRLRSSDLPAGIYRIESSSADELLGLDVHVSP